MYVIAFAYKRMQIQKSLKLNRDDLESDQEALREITITRNEDKRPTTAN